MADRSRPPDGRRMSRISPCHGVDDPQRQTFDFANLQPLVPRDGAPCPPHRLAAIGVTSLLVHQSMKLAARRRPRRTQVGVPETRWMYADIGFVPFRALGVRRGTTFCVAISAVVPEARWPLRVVAAAVAFSRLHTEV